MKQMKKLLALLLVIVTLVSHIPPFTVYAASGGTGTKYDPYLISGKYDLSRINQNPGAYYKLTRDIIFTEADFQKGGSYYNSGKGWEPIGDQLTPFTGTFDGDGHIISGLVVNSYYAAGLFGSVKGGTIKNLGMVNSRIVGDGETAGGIVWYAQGATITNCYNTGYVYSTEDTLTAAAGGIVGTSDGGTTITNCYNAGNITAIQNADTAYYQCPAYAGGIVGHSYSNTTIRNCYNVGRIGASGYGSYANGITEASTVTIANCYSLSYTAVSTIEVPGEKSVTNCTNAQMIDRATYVGFDFDTVWSFNSESEYPLPTLQSVPHVNQYQTSDTDKFASGTGSFVNPYRIETKAQLNNVRYDLTAHYILMADIAFTSADFASTGIFYNEGKGWQPIGTGAGTSASFSGTFDGNGHVVKNLKMNDPDCDYAGLFGCVSGGTISNLGVENASVTGGRYVGGIVGLANNNATLTNCYSTSKVTAKEHAKYTTSASAYAGGLVGDAGKGTKFLNCYSTASTTATATAEKDASTYAYAGGFAGALYSGCRVSNCYNTGTAYASAETMAYAGGIAGDAYGLPVNTISNCYSTAGSIQAYAATVYIGGITGYSGKITNCYYSDQVSKGTGVACTLEELQQQATFVGFDFDDVWCIDTLRSYKYPQLRSNLRKPAVTDVTISTFPVEITVFPYKVITVQGMVPELTGGEITVTYSDGHSAATAITADMLNDLDLDKVGQQECRIDYCGVLSEETILVDVVAKDLDGIQVTTTPTKLQYVKDQPLNLSGGKITLYYNNNETEEIDLSQTELTYDKEATGTVVVTVKYQGYRDTFEITVNPKVVKSISLLQKPTKLEYIEGCDLDLTGGILKVSYESEDNYFENIPLTESMISGYDKNTLGYQVVMIDYQGHQVNFRVITVAKSLTEVKVTEKPNKLTYVEGDPFDATGMVVVAHYDNGASKIVTDLATISGYSAAPGTKTVTVSYEGKMDTFTVTVIEKQVVSIAVTKKPDKLHYFEDEALDRTGMVVTSYYNNGASAVVTDYTTSMEAAMPGLKTVTVSYAGQTDAFEITVDYLIVFKDWNGAALSSKTYNYGQRVEVPANPQRAADNTYTYAFVGWDKSVVSCVGNATYTAVYASSYIDYTIVFKDWNGTVLSTKNYRWGEKVTAPANPTKAADDTYTYAFAGWDKKVVACAGNTTYTATYTAAYIDYTVIFADEDGTVLSTKTYHWGDKVAVPAGPTKAADDTYTYTFAGWDKEVVACAGNATYTATYTSAYIDYTVIFVDEDGTELSKKSYHWGDAVIAPSDPAKAEDDTYTYIFAGWDKEIVNCAGDATYTAVYTPVKKPVVWVAVDGKQMEYVTLAEALKNAPADSTLTLIKDVGEDIHISKNICLDLNGFDLSGNITVSSGAVLLVKDSQTDDYTIQDGAGYGKLMVTVTGVQAESGYIMITEADGVSFHRIDLLLTDMTLRPSAAGVYYKSNFAGDEIVAQNVACYGVALSVAGAPSADALGICSWYDSFAPGAGANAANGTLLHGIMKSSNSEAVNAANAGMPIYGRAYILTKDGQYIFGESVSRSLREQVELIDAQWDALTSEQRSALLSMYENYQSVMANWNISNIKSDYASAGTMAVTSLADGFKEKRTLQKNR